jgi:hypothetical protein
VSKVNKTYAKRDILRNISKHNEYPLFVMVMKVIAKRTEGTAWIIQKTRLCHENESLSRLLRRGKHDGNHVNRACKLIVFISGGIIVDRSWKGSSVQSIYGC